MRDIVTLEVVGGNLVISPRIDDEHDRDELDGATDILDVLEHKLCNGWHVIPPEQIGALTAGLILAEDVEFSDVDGTVKELGTVYWDRMYETVDALAELRAGRSVTFEGHPAVLA